MHRCALTLDKAESNVLYKVTKMRVDAETRERLRELGLIIGTELTLGRTSKKGEITSYYVRGSQIAFRKKTARLITVERIDESDPKEYFPERNKI